MWDVPYVTNDHAGPQGRDRHGAAEEFQHGVGVRSGTCGGGEGEPARGTAEPWRRARGGTSPQTSAKRARENVCCGCARRLGRASPAPRQASDPANTDRPLVPGPGQE